MQGILNVILIIHLIIAVLLIGLILLQKSEGGALGIGGSGAGGGNLFSARGVGNGLTRGTAILAVCFFATSIALTVLATRKTVPTSVFGDAPAAEQGQPASGDGQSGGGSLLPNLGQGTGGQGTAPATPQVPTNN
jgi:preprotein translocase subunit SecG